jgi:hypothetical protein
MRAAPFFAFQVMAAEQSNQEYYFSILQPNGQSNSAKFVNFFVGQIPNSFPNSYQGYLPYQ